MKDRSLAFVEGLLCSPMSEDAEQLTIGEALRDAGMAAAWEHSPDDWRRDAIAAIERLARSKEPFTSEDLRAQLGDVPNPNAVGHVFQWAARTALIVKTGAYRNATRPEAHATELPLWIGNPEVIDAR